MNATTQITLTRFHELQVVLVLENNVIDVIVQTT